MVSPAISVNTATATHHIGITMYSGEQSVCQVHTLLLTPLIFRYALNISHVVKTLQDFGGGK